MAVDVGFDNRIRKICIYEFCIINVYRTAIVWASVVEGKNDTIDRRRKH